MRLRERDLRTVTLHRATDATAELYAWGAGTPARAAIYPGGQALRAQLTGERAEETRWMLCDVATDVELGMGVCVDAADGQPDFRVTALERWAHIRATLTRIPERRRAHDV